VIAESQFDSLVSVMRRALELARRGEGWVEPNPMVGAVIVDDNLSVIGEGWHERFGGPHAEVMAIRSAGERARGRTLFVTLEPCCHHGKTGPCTQAVLAAGIQRVFVAQLDPAPWNSGRGIAELRAAGVVVETGLLEQESAALTAPFVKKVTTGLPWVHAKWAMTLDGKIATKTGHSQWISNPLSRECVHELRGRMDAVIVGAGTARADDPLLTARPPGPRIPWRIVCDEQAALPLNSQLARTAAESTVLVVASPFAPRENVERLVAAGIEVLQIEANSRSESLRELLRQLASRGLTNVLVEGGSTLLGTCFDADVIDEVHVFIAPKLVGGATAFTPLGGCGLDQVPQFPQLHSIRWESCGDDLRLQARVLRSALPAVVP